MFKNKIKDNKKNFYKLNQERYSQVIKKIQKKVLSGEKIRVGFFVMFDSIVAYKPVYKKMLKDDLFEPFIIVIPDTSRGKEHMIFNFTKTYKSLKKEFKSVYRGYDIKNKKFIDYSNKMDMIHFHSPYEGMSHKFFEIKYFIDKDILPFYISYCFSVTNYFKEEAKLDSYSLYWKIFIENKYCLKELRKFQQIRGKNAIVTGYPKMDDLFELENENKDIKTKTIIIAPHHTVIDWEYLKISNFLEYSDFFLILPKKYPKIKFIFRPHPLLKTQLKRPDVWGEIKTNVYFEKIKKIPNMIYSEGGDYLKIFMESSGIIHDCASFLAEYLFTGKPECYLLKDELSIKKWFMSIGQKCLKYCYKAYNQKDVIDFINNIILDKKDIYKQKRINFVNSKLKINYPNVSDYIVRYIKKEILKNNLSIIY